MTKVILKMKTKRVGVILEVNTWWRGCSINNRFTVRVSTLVICTVCTVRTVQKWGDSLANWKEQHCIYFLFNFFYKDLASAPCLNLNTVAYFQYQVTGHINITSNSLVHLFWMFLLGINVISLKTNKQAKTMKLHSLISLGYFKGYVHLSQTTNLWSCIIYYLYGSL